MWSRFSLFAMVFCLVRGTIPSLTTQALRQTLQGGNFVDQIDKPYIGRHCFNDGDSCCTGAGRHADDNPTGYKPTGYKPTGYNPTDRNEWGTGHGYRGDLGDRAARQVC